MVEYENLVLEIFEKEEQGYPINVKSLLGEEKDIFNIPFTPQELTLWRELLRITLSNVQVVRSSSERLGYIPEILGKKLFNAAFTSSLNDFYHRCLEAARSRGKGLRIRLKVDPPEVNSLPWEFLCDDSTNEFLALSKETPIVRLSTDITELLQIFPPINILLIVANPIGTVRIKLERETELINSALQGLIRDNKVILKTIEARKTSEELVKLAYEEPIHVIHFIGHGQSDALFLETPEGEKKTIVTEAFCEILRNINSLRLVVLNACETAHNDPTEARLGLAIGLAKKRIPAIVAMQFPISDNAACKFAHIFYDALANNYPIDYAVTMARLAIHAETSTPGYVSAEWGTPVLYLNSQDSSMWDIQVPKVTLPIGIESKDISVTATIENLQSSNNLVEFRSKIDDYDLVKSIPYDLFYSLLSELVEQLSQNIALDRAGELSRTHGAIAMHFARKWLDRTNKEPKEELKQIAKRSYTLALAFDPDNGWIINDYCMNFLTKIGQTEEALGLLEQNIERGHLASFFTAANLHATYKNDAYHNKKAIEYFERYIAAVQPYASNPTHPIWKNHDISILPTACSMVASLFSRNINADIPHRFEQAEYYYNLALNIFPSLFRNETDKARTYHERGKFYFLDRKDPILAKNDYDESVKIYRRLKKERREMFILDYENYVKPEYKKFFGETLRED